MNWKLIFLLSIIVVITACGSDSDTPFDPNLGNAPENPDEQMLSDLINDLRENGQKCNGTQMPAVPILTFNTTLNEAAKNHATYMNNLDELTHIGANNSDVGDRLDAAGYTYSVAAENLAKGYADEVSVINAWKNSDEHCENMMKAAVREMGVGTSGAYWVMIYAVE